MIRFIENIDISFRYQYIESAASISILYIYIAQFLLFKVDLKFLDLDSIASNKEFTPEIKSINRLITGI